MIQKSSRLGFSFNTYHNSDFKNVSLVISNSQLQKAVTEVFFFSKFY